MKHIKKKDSPTIARPSSDGSMCDVPLYALVLTCSFLSLFFVLFLCSVLFPLCFFPCVSLLPVSVLLLAVQAQVVIEPSDVFHPNAISIEKEPLQAIGVKAVIGAKGVMHLMCIFFGKAL